MQGVAEPRGLRGHNPPGPQADQGAPCVRGHLAWDVGLGRVLRGSEINVSGIAASYHHPIVCFSKRFLQLRDLPKLNLPGWELEVPDLFKDTDRHPQDVVMVCKQFWASDQLAQPPLLWCPHSLYAGLKQVPWARKDRNVMSERHMKEYKKTAAAVVQKPWCLLRAGAYLEKWVADNQAGTYGAPPTIPLLTSMVGSEPVWGEDMAVEWQEYAPVPPAKIQVGPPKKRIRIEAQAVCGDRPRDVIPQPAGAPALPAPVSDDHEMGRGAGAPALPAPVNEEAKEEDDEPALPALTHQEVGDDMAMRAILAGDMPWQSQPGAGAPALPAPVNAEEEPRPALGVGAPALLAPPVRRRPAAAAAAPVAPALLAPQAKMRPAAAAAAPAARPAAKARGKAHPKAHAKARAKAHPKARGMQLGCSKCRWTSCSVCKDLGWRQRRAACEAREA